VPCVPLRPTTIIGTPVRHDAIPECEERAGVEVWHPRFAAIPKLGLAINPLVMATRCLPLARRLNAAVGGFDLVDAQYLFPDAVAGVILARWLGKPALMTARGSDVNVLARQSLPAAWMRWAWHRAAGVITVSAKLKQELVALGVEDNRVTVLRNGVNLDLFRPLDRDAARRQTSIDGRTLLSVGNLVAEKGHDIVIRALGQLPVDTRLVVIGQGPERERLQELARALRLHDRVRWVEHVSQELLAQYYCAADLTVLASHREGMPNVVLESLACGTPVVASAVGGIPEVLGHDAVAGTLVERLTPEDFTGSIASRLQAAAARDRIRAHAQGFGWDATIARQLDLFRQAAGLMPS
ncbi:MAG TPA: glycosyltransferase, partial [Steroidobacteraceae bacterium]|nr:glycosyltransferase [Steroidobacteraceae bacterium]